MNHDSLLLFASNEKLQGLLRRDIGRCSRPLGLCSALLYLRVNSTKVWPSKSLEPTSPSSSYPKSICMSFALYQRSRSALLPRTSPSVFPTLISLEGKRELCTNIASYLRMLPVNIQPPIFSSRASFTYVCCNRS